MSNKPIVLTILDGWGYRPETHGNAIALARKPVYDKLLIDYPNTLIRASDHYVGLPDGQMGNSEVGHLNLGAGRIVCMDITRIDAAIADGSFFADPVLATAIKLAAKRDSALHIFGLLSDGGVHSHQRHLYALLRLAAQHRVARVYVHAFMDGRDTMPNSGLGHLEALLQQFREIGLGQLASVNGRYYAMDRDLRWEKEHQAFEAMVTGAPEGGAYHDPIARIRELYNNGITDEFIPPFTCVDAEGHPVGLIRDNDVCINFNYRADRVRQITRVLARNCDVPGGLTASDANDLPKAAELEAEIPRARAPKNIHYVCMTRYDKNFNLGEDRVLIPSQKVATYDLAPEMSASGIADAVVKAVNDTAFDVIIVNFANADMVGHSGKLEPTIRAVETVDTQLGRIYQAIKQRGGALLVTADHGNAELLIDPVTGGPHTAHTTSPVPFILVTDEADTSHHRILRPGGSLRDISPTMLTLLGLHQPKEMTGTNLSSEKK